jgi:hypothetical protein
MQISYVFKTDLAYYDEAFEKYRRTHWFYRIGQAIKWIGLVVLALCWVAVVIQRVWLLVATLTAFIALIWFSPFLERKYFHRSWSQSPFLNSEYGLSFSNAGLESEAHSSKSQCTWDVVTKAVRFSDGWLLFYGPQLYCWLQDSKLVAGSLEDVEQLVRQKVPLVSMM